MVICTGWTVFKVGSAEVHSSPDSTPASPISLSSTSFKSCPHWGLSPWAPWSGSRAGASTPQRWALWSFIFNCMQKYIYIKNAEQCLFNSDTVYLLLNLCLEGQLTRNYLSITFRSLYALWSAGSSLDFKHVCYSLWFPSSVISHEAALNIQHQKEMSYHQN